MLHTANAYLYQQNYENSIFHSRDTREIARPLDAPIYFSTNKSLMIQRIPLLYMSQHKNAASTTATATATATTFRPSLLRTPLSTGQFSRQPLLET